MRNEKHRKASSFDHSLSSLLLFLLFVIIFHFGYDIHFAGKRKEKDDTFDDERMTIHANESIRTRRKRDQSINPRSHIHFYFPFRSKLCTKSLISFFPHRQAVRRGQYRCLRTDCQKVKLKNDFDFVLGLGRVFFSREIYFSSFRNDIKPSVLLCVFNSIAKCPPRSLVKKHVRKE